MTPQQLTEKLREVCGTRLKSVVLHGSAVAGDHAGRRSDYNVLVVLDPIELDDLKELSMTIKTWIKTGSPPPHFFTPQELAGAVDVFPLEISDIHRSHEILYGQDLVSILRIHKEDLRVQLERELKTKLIQLRQRYLIAAGNVGEMTQLLVQSLSGVLVLLRGTLLLYQPEVPAKKMDAVRQLAGRISIQPQSLKALEIIEQLKRGEKIPAANVEELFSDYLKAIESVVNALDHHLQERSS